MDHLAHLADALLEDSVGGRIGDHDGGQLLPVADQLLFQIHQVDVPLVVTVHYHDAHAGHHRRSRVGSVGGGGYETDPTVVFPPVQVVGADGGQPGQFPLGSGVGLEGHGRIAGDLGEPVLQVGEELQIPFRLIDGDEGMNV